MSHKKYLAVAVLCFQATSFVSFLENASARGKIDSKNVLHTSVRSELRRNTRKTEVSGSISPDRKRVAGDIKGLLNNSKGLRAKTADSADLTVTQDRTVKGAKKTIRLGQSYQGIPLAHADLLATVENETSLTRVDGLYFDQISKPVIPAKTAMQARAVISDLMASHSQVKIEKEPSLAFFPADNDIILSWMVSVSYMDDEIPAAEDIYLNAKTLKVLSRESKIHAATPSGFGISTNIGGNLAAYEGGASVSFTGWQDTLSGGYYMQDPELGYFVYNDSPDSGLYPYDTKSFAFRPTASWGTSDTEELSLGYNTHLALRYHKQLANLTGFDLAQGGIASIAHKQSANCPNAYFYAGALHFCDGYASLDIVAHELEHAVTDISSKLVYAYEPGALNESFSDILGTTIEFMNQPTGSGAGKADWLVGEDSPDGIYRNLKNPELSYPLPLPSRYFGSYWRTGSSDNGGVHSNSSVQNKFFYLLSEGGTGVNDGLAYSFSGIGVQNAGSLGYLANLAFALPEDGYQEIRTRWKSAANALDPSGTYARAVDNAWDAVGVYATPEIPAVSDFDFEKWLPSSAWNTSSWVSDTATGADGTHSLRSGVVGHSQSSSLTWSGSTPYDGYLSFFAKTSSEAIYDGLQIVIDGITRKKITGENNWFNVQIFLPKGNHTIEWKYVKDSSVTEGSDAAWIDGVSLIYPKTEFTVVPDTVSTPSSLSGGVVYTNDRSAHLSLSASGGSADYFIFDGSLNQISSGSIATGSTNSAPFSLAASEGLQDFGVVLFLRDPYHNYSIFAQSYFLDTTGPVSSLSSYSSNPVFVYTGSVFSDLSGAVSSDNGVGLSATPYAYELRGQNGLVSSGTAATPYADLSLPQEGIYSIHWSVSDLLGNISPSAYTGSFVFDITPPVVAYTGSNPFVINFGDTLAQLPTALGNDAVDGAKTVSASGSYDAFTEGDYPITFQYTDTAGNISNLVSSTVRVQDIGAPVITLVGDQDVSMPIDSEYTESGAVWEDNKDGSGAVSVISGALDTHALGIYTLTYSYTDIAGNTGNTTRTIRVMDPNAPVITLIGSGSVTSELGAAYHDQGATWTDLKDGSGMVASVSDTVDTSHTGSYQVSYTQIDSDGLSSSLSRTVTVVDTVGPNIVFASGSSVTIASGSILAIASIQDLGGVSTPYWNGEPGILSGSNASYNSPLTPGANIFTLAVSDASGNSSTGTFVAHRVPKVESFSLTYSGNTVVVQASLDFTGSLHLAMGASAGSLTSLQTAMDARQYTLTFPNTDAGIYVKFATEFDGAMGEYSEVQYKAKPVIAPVTSRGGSSGGGSGGYVPISASNTSPASSAWSADSSASATSSSGNPSTFSMSELMQQGVIHSASFGAKDQQEAANAFVIEHYSKPILKVFLTSRNIKDSDVVKQKKAMTLLIAALDKKIRASKNIKEKYVYRASRAWYEQQRKNLSGPVRTLKASAHSATVPSQQLVRTDTYVIPNNKKNIRRK